MRRSDALAEKLLADGKCPVEALVRLAERAEAEGDFSQAIGAWKSILPYIHPKPKAVEIEPEHVVALARDLAAARASGMPEAVSETFAERVKRAAERLETG